MFKQCGNCGRWDEKNGIRKCNIPPSTYCYSIESCWSPKEHEKKAYIVEFKVKCPCGAILSSKPGQEVKCVSCCRIWEVGGNSHVTEVVHLTEKEGEAFIKSLPPDQLEDIMKLCGTGNESK